MFVLLMIRRLVRERSYNAWKIIRATSSPIGATDAGVKAHRCSGRDITIPLSNEQSTCHSVEKLCGIEDAKLSFESPRVLHARLLILSSPLRIANPAPNDSRDAPTTTRCTLTSTLRAALQSARSATICDSSLNDTQTV